MLAPERHDQLQRVLRALPQLPVLVQHQLVQPPHKRSHKPGVCVRRAQEQLCVIHYLVQHVLGNLCAGVASLPGVPQQEDDDAVGGRKHSCFSLCTVAAPAYSHNGAAVSTTAVRAIAASTATAAVGTTSRSRPRPDLEPGQRVTQEHNDLLLLGDRVRKDACEDL